MDWQRMRRSQNVEYRNDRRAFGGRAGIGIGGFIVVLVLGWLVALSGLSRLARLHEVFRASWRWAQVTAVLEVKGGLMRQLGIGVGAKLRHPDYFKN